MTDHLRLDHEGADDDVVRGLRAVYAAPQDEGYWRRLEARIMARIAAPDDSIGWWDELDRWMRPALVAAAIVLIATGVVAFRTHQAEEEVAFEAMLTPTTLPVETAVRPMTRGPEGTFRYLMTKPR